MIFRSLLIAAALFLANPAMGAISTQYQSVAAYDQTVTVSVSTTTSGVIDLHGTTLAGIFVPAQFDGTTITIMASSSPTGTFVPVQDGTGSTMTITTAASNYVPITNLALVAGLRYIEIVTGTTQTTTDTVFTLALRPV
jgi:hypothetical protein